MPNEAPEDLGPTKRQQLCSELGTIVGSLEALSDRITKDAEEAMRWYLRAKRPKQRWAMFLRVSAIAAGTVAGIIPILAQIFATDGKPAISTCLGISGAWACGGARASGSLFWIFEGRSGLSLGREARGRYR